MPERVLSVEDVRVTFGRGAASCAALAGVSLDFEKGRLTLVQGPSGSGKTTLLSVLGCLLKPDSGRVWVEDREVSRLSEGKRGKIRQRSIGFVFQTFRLFDSLSALDNVTIAGILAGSAQRSRARQLLEELGLRAKLRLKPDQLSGGEKQRVAIARALLRNPPIMLADEPTASLDRASGEQIAAILHDLSERQGRTVVVVSHDPRWEALAHRVVRLADGKVTGVDGVREAFHVAQAGKERS